MRHRAKRAGKHKKEEKQKHIQKTAKGRSKKHQSDNGTTGKLVPSVELKVGNSFSQLKSGKTLTINPQP